MLVDGDTLLVVGDKSIINVAKRNMKDTVPLYYNMKKAGSTIISNETIYEGLINAFTHGNIGMYSNDISKIWNDDVFVNGTEEQKRDAVECVNLLTAENNWVIDAAKTLYVPEFPDTVKERITKYTKNKLPHFFLYAKDKLNEQIEDNNGSFVNQLENIIINPRLSYKKLEIGNLNYKKLMHNTEIKFDIVLKDNGIIDVNKTDPMIVKFLELSKIFYYKIDYDKISSLPYDALRKSQIRQQFIYGNVVKLTKEEMSNFDYNEQDMVDILVKTLYYIKPNSHKSLLWLCYGDVLYKNLKRRSFSMRVRAIQCLDCGEWVTKQLQ